MKQTLLIPTTQEKYIEEQLFGSNLENNIFRRLIRNPRVNKETPKERECTEMLCTILLKSRSFLKNFILWCAADDEKIKGIDIDSLDFEIATEQAIKLEEGGNSKRDDLRIEGFLESEEGRVAKFLWTIEVKVGAQFHESEGRGGVVNQITNYDNWLCSDEHKGVHEKRGFVLALKDYNKNLPKGLNGNWKCFTWTSLGTFIMRVLKENRFEAVEAFLLKDTYDFIRSYLWRDEEMTIHSEKINFNDIALFKAFDEIGSSSIHKMEGFIEDLGLPEMMEGHSFSKEKINAKGKGLFTQGEEGSNKGSKSYGQLISSKLKFFSLRAGFISYEPVGFKVILFGYKNEWARVYDEVKKIFPKLVEQNSGWHINDKGDPSLSIIVKTLPIENILGAEDQEEVVKNFFRDSFDELKVSGMIEGVQKYISDKER